MRTATSPFSRTRPTQRSPLADGGEAPSLGEINMGNSVYSTPIVADNVLYISNRTHLFAIENQED